MQERDARLLFKAGHWKSAKVVSDAANHGWNVLLVPASGTATAQILSAKRGGPRVFRTADAALSWCQEIGFHSVKVHMEPVQDAAAEGNERPVMRAARNRILLIEDNEDDIALTLRAFKKQNVVNTIIVKRDGAEALSFLSSNAADELPSLVLLDLNLPKMDGLEVLRQIRATERTRYIPVVILTTSDEPRDIHQGYELGTNSYVQKPVDFHVFTRKLEQIGKYWLEVNIPPLLPA